MLKKVATTIVALSCMCVGGAAAANAAVTWNSISTPLEVTGYGSIGQAYGSFTVSTGSDGTRARSTNKAKLKKQADNHKVYIKQKTYVNAGSCVASEYTSCTQAYYFYAENDSAHALSLAWSNANVKTGVPATGNYARGEMFVKLDIPMRGDSGSKGSLTKGVRY